MKQTDQVPKEEKGPRRAIRSFLRREGRMTSAQRRALEGLWSRYGLELDDGPIDIGAAFGRRAPCVLEIGFGMGGSLLEMAGQSPEQDFIGIEVYRPGLGALLQGLEAQGLTNVRVYCADAVEVLKSCIPDESLDRVQIYFPDPWPKRRHHKRRLIQPPFLDLICQKLRADGCLHLATDVQAYAKHMLKVLDAHPGLLNQAGTGQYSPRPAWRPLTKYELRGQGLGHGVWDLISEVFSDV